MRENHQIALYVACGDLKDVEIAENTLRVYVEDSTMHTLLTEGRRELERALSWQGLNLNVEVLQKEIPLTKAEEDIKKLKNIFGSKLTIK